MLKVLINEEEVLTNKNFTIKKEMLNTPSVILNNVYPKTWEDEKDYTSNFYHPQDYSKCKIIDETIIPAEPGETISGTSFTIQNNDNTKINELTEIDGNTTQSGTPTPSSPQPINVVSGRQEVSVVGKNLLDLSKFVSITVNSGITLINDAITGKVKLNGTAIRNTFITYSTEILNSGDVVSLSANNSMINSNVAIRLYDITSAQTSPNVELNVVNKTSNGIILNRSFDGFQIRIASGTTLNDFELYPQIEKGSTATEYEEYKGQSYEINLGKNLYNSEIELGTINTSTGANENATNCVRSKGYVAVQPNTTYTISNNKNYQEVMYFYGSDKSFKRAVSGSTGNYTFTTRNNEYYIRNRTSQGSNQNDTSVLFQLEKGSQATSYAPYKTPIELCKINTYKDRIYKENGTWYLHKEIGKVVLNGSELWQGSNNYFYSTAIDNYALWNSYQNYSNYFKSYNERIIPSTVVSEDSMSVGGSNATDILRIRIKLVSLSISTANDFKTWLSTHNTTVYYVLATPTTTEITDSELISQLESIELLEGLNNVSVSSGYLPGEITIHYNYTEEQTIDDLLFCGVVKNSGNISLNPRQPHFQSLQILDFKTFLSEGELDSFVIYQKTILEAIQMVIANIQDYGFILGNINILNPTDIIGAYSTKDKTAYDVFNYIADITQSRWTTRLIDENHVAIDFYDPTLMIEGTPINYTQTFFEDNLIDDMTYSYGSNNYRNKQVMTSSQVYSNISQQQSIVANGYQTQFPTEQPIGKINSITSNGIPLTFATFNEKEMGYVADFYYSPGDNYFESEDLRTTGEILIIDYVAIVEGRQIITNPLEIDRINESTGRKGIISRYEQRNDATTSTELQKIGESYIKYKGTPEIKLKISTRSNIWEVGQRVQFNAPIEELDTEYMVRTKKINYISTIDTIFYEYELISSFNSETEINYFDNQRAKSSGNIGEGEYISRNIDIESTANIIFYDTETTEVQVDGDNVLNSILNSPFTS